MTAKEARLSKLDETTAELRHIVEETLGADLIERLSVTAREDHSGEPAYYVSVTMKSSKDVPTTAVGNDLTHRMRLALAERDDDRFPYLYVGAADWENGPEDSDDFQDLDEEIGRA
jgi:hypothetical protein